MNNWFSLWETVLLTTEPKLVPFVNLSNISAAEFLFEITNTLIMCIYCILNPHSFSFPRSFSLSSDLSPPALTLSYFLYHAELQACSLGNCLSSWEIVLEALLKGNFTKMNIICNHIEITGVNSSAQYLIRGRYCFNPSALIPPETDKFNHTPHCAPATPYHFVPHSHAM